MMDADLDAILGTLTAAPKPVTRPTVVATEPNAKPIYLPFKDASTKFRNGASLDEQIVADDMQGVIFKRIPMPIPDFENYRSIPSYNYHASNGRKVEVKIVINFNSPNLVITAGATSVLLGARTVEMYLKPGESSHICTCEPLDKRANTFDPFNADVLVYPSHGETKVEDLEDVKLFTRIEYGEQTRVEFEALNGKHYAVVVEVSPKGEILSKSGSIPLRAEVRPGERVRIGSLTCSKDITSSWRWETSPNANLPQPPQEKKVSKTEAKGVFLTQTQTPGERNLLEFELENTLATNIIAEIDLKGNQIDWYGKTNPLKVPVKARSKVGGGSVTFKGDIAVAFGWREDR